MSENLNRGIRDFSKYDSMETAELEQILLLDTEAPDGAESDTELLLHVMEVLAHRRNNTNITGNTAQQAWESFQQNYMPHGIHDSKSRTDNKVAAAPWVRHLIAAAAVIALVIVIPVSAKAFSLEKLWDAIATWAKETFSFISSEDVTGHEVTASSPEDCISLQDALMKSNRDPNIAPTWTPDGFMLERIEKEITPVQEVYLATYLKDNNILSIKIQSFLETNPWKLEISEGLIETYEHNGLVFYIFSNNTQIQAIWKTDSYECYIAGDLSIDELKQMINSITKG